MLDMASVRRYKTTNDEKITMLNSVSPYPKTKNKRIDRMVDKYKQICAVSK